MYICYRTVSTETRFAKNDESMSVRSDTALTEVVLATTAA